MLRKGRRRMVVACNMLMRVGQIPVKHGLAVWRALVRPVLEYGCEVWWEEADQVWGEAEAVQIEMLKRILRCGPRIPNDVVLGEMGVLPLRVRRDMLRLGFWTKILSYSDKTWVKRLYNEGRRRFIVGQEKNWSSFTHSLLQKYGCLEDWDSDEFDPDLKDRMRAKVWEVAERDWQARISLKSSLSDYKSWKSSLKLEKYLLKNERHFETDFGRRHLIRFRAGVSVDTGRWERSVSGKGLERASRKCLMCYAGRG